MAQMQRKLIIIILLACGILTYSFYSSWQKESLNQEIAVEVPAANESAVGNHAQKWSDSEVVVYVSGGVNKPGVYKLAKDSRVVDAVTAAGGFAPGSDAAKINLALHVKDEMHVNVPYAISVGNKSDPAAARGVGNSSSDIIYINTASAAEFDKLPGIGPALAERIVQYRTTNGPFKDIDDIKKVPGIGEAKFNQMKEKLSL